MKPHILRVHDGAGRWIISNGEHTLKCGTAATLKSAVHRWEAIHGKPSQGYIRVAGGLCRTRAEAFLDNLRGQLPKSCLACGCTDDDCRQCVEATGHACSWVPGEDPPICSRCYYPTNADGTVDLAELLVRKLEAAAEGGAR